MNKPLNQKVFSNINSHKSHLLASLGLYTDRNDRFSASVNELWYLFLKKKKDRTQHLTYICRSLDRVKIFWLLVYVWTDENGGFRIRWNHILIALRTLCKGCCRISKVFVFSWTGKNVSNTLSVDAHFLEHREKSLFTKISGYATGLSLNQVQSRYLKCGLPSFRFPMT